MARRTDSPILTSLTSLLPRKRIRELARVTGAVKRRRKLDIVALVYALVLGFSEPNNRSLVGFRRAYLCSTGQRLAASSFYARLNAGLSRLMRALMMDALRQMTRVRPKLRDVFAPFIEVLAVDSALLRLHDALEPHYHSVWTHYMKASAKLTIVMNVIGRGAARIGITHGSRHDVHLIAPGPWLKERLLVFDLGFFSAVLFQRIDAHGGYFLSRARKHANPVIVATRRRAHQHLVGMKLRDALALVHDDIVDIDAEMGYMLKHSPFTHYCMRLRYVAVFNHELDRWHCYLTNLPPSLMQARHFAAVYAARWEVELLFRELKGHYRIEQMPSGNLHISRILIYAALLTLLLSRKLHRMLAARWRIDPSYLPLDRWAVLFSSVASELLVLLLDRRDAHHRLQRLERLLRTEAVDPNRNRVPLAYRAQHGLHAPA